MPIAGLLALVAETPEFQELRHGLVRPGQEVLAVGLSGSQKALFIASLYRTGGRDGHAPLPLLVVTHTAYQADRLHGDLTTLLSQEDVQLFPALEALPHEEVVRDPRLTRDRLRVLERLLFGQPGIVVTSVQALAERLPPAEWLRVCSLQLEVGQRVPMGEVAARLAQLGYERVAAVEGPGQFSVRGGIVDVFPATAELPVRAEWFDDEVDSLRIFDPATQRSAGSVTSLRVMPAREFLIPPDQLEPGLDRLLTRVATQAQRLRSLGREEEAKALEERVAQHAEKLSQGVLFEGADQYRPFFYDEMPTLAAYLQAGVAVLDEPARIREHLTTMESEFSERHGSLLEKGRVLPDEARLYASWHDILDELRRRPILHLSGLATRTPGMEPDRVVQVNARMPELFHGRMEAFLQEVQRWRRQRYRVCLVLSTRERAERVTEAMKEEGLPALLAAEVDGQLKLGNVVVTTGSLETGAEFPSQRLVVLTDTEVFGRQRRRRTVRSEGRGHRIDFGDLRPGDYVVHVNHGIGRYLGVETLEVAGIHKDYLVVQYAGEDRLYVPTEQIDHLQRYIGVDGQPPKLNKLGSAEWARVKKRVRESVQEMAQNLLRLYAEREAQPGHAFSPDTVWQQQFEDAFPYEETPDQLRAIEEVKRDMERPRPMDRLLCGDVGYGKTEVAIRAAFKAVMDGKQVAVLVPTTILAQQHGRTFTERFEGYPVTIKVLSRFQTAAEQRAILKGIENGSVDIVIGTHRLLSKDVKFKDLGLVVVDEEQRFGVVQKERLKELCKNVDALTLSATPIPRTLHMSLVGMRDMSIIETPPEGRFPIRTYVVEYNEDLVREAILRELAREGQVYFVYNRVQSIDQMASRLMELVPEARIAVAHGQMEEEQLERVMLDFLEGEFDVLVCSTIIETGMDIPNVNTLIVYEADHMGLAQLYQLRGRVGRSNRVAYAYFTYRKDRVLSEDAEKRLQAIKEFTDLGSGFKIALRDLEIRGAGNLLGPEQHGFIASVGFELYCKLLEEAIRELKGEAVQQLPDPTIDVRVDAYIPDEYVPEPQQKVELYKKVAAIRSVEEAGDLAEEMRDRFGEPPDPVKNLLAVARVKVWARQARVAQIAEERDGVVLKLAANTPLPQNAWLQLTRRFRGRVAVVPGRLPVIKVRVQGLAGGEVLSQLEEVLRTLKELTGPEAAPRGTTTNGAAGGGHQPSSQGAPRGSRPITVS